MTVFLLSFSLIYICDESDINICTFRDEWSPLITQMFCKSGRLTLRFRSTFCIHVVSVPSATTAVLPDLPDQMESVTGVLIFPLSNWMIFCPTKAVLGVQTRRKNRARFFKCTLWVMKYVCRKINFLCIIFKLNVNFPVTQFYRYIWHFRSLIDVLSWSLNGGIWSRNFQKISFKCNHFWLRHVTWNPFSMEKKMYGAIQSFVNFVIFMWFFKQNSASEKKNTC